MRQSVAGFPVGKVEVADAEGGESYDGESRAVPEEEDGDGDDKEENEYGDGDAEAAAKDAATTPLFLLIRIKRRRDHILRWPATKRG